jgi:hypothetical protein
MKNVRGLLRQYHMSCYTCETEAASYGALSAGALKGRAMVAGINDRL